MKTISIDIETFSSVDLAKCGVYKYTEATDFDILLFGYSADGSPVQVVDLASGEPAIGDGVGQLVVTRLDLEYPLLRLATDWQGHWLAKPSACGRTNRRLKLV